LLIQAGFTCRLKQAVPALFRQKGLEEIMASGGFYQPPFEEL
jgi:hypothetical protein